jgi:hypothetical protein
MKTFLRFLGPLLVLAALVTSSKEAHALGPLDLEIGGKIGFGTNPISGSPINPLGLGLGGRAGVTLLGFYGGVNIVDYLGGSQGPVSESALEYGLELGYTLKVLMLRIRPQVGFGNITFNYSGSESLGGVNVSGSTSQSSFYLEPGATVLATFGILFVGVDANALIVTSGPPNSGATSSTSTDVGFTLHGQVGVTF